MDPSRGHGRIGVALFALALMGTTPEAASAASVVLSENLSAATGGTEAASGGRWLTASFGTDASSYTLESVTLLLANASTGQASLALYTDDGLQPGSLVGTLTSPGSYSNSLTNTTFTASGITLAGNSTYWVVLKAIGGQFDWSWTADNTGSGAGFQHTWGASDDAGATWFTYDIYPTQLSVSATAAAVPKPGSMILLGSGAVVLLGYSLYRRRGSGRSPATQQSCRLA
jgi:hypothetical protein